LGLFQTGQSHDLRDLDPSGAGRGIAQPCDGTVSSTRIPHHAFLRCDTNLRLHHGKRAVAAIRHGAQIERATGPCAVPSTRDALCRFAGPERAFEFVRANKDAHGAD
jgi:hypothetical protein